MAQKPSFTGSQYKEYLGEFKDEFNNVLAGLQESDFPKRILEKDFTLWSSSPDEIVNRLGWLHLPDANSEEAQSIKQFYSNISGQDFTSVLLLGMGGSSLAPEMFAKVFPGLNDLEIRVLDSTDPDYIKAVRAGIDLKKTLVIVSSKSGSTVETASLMNYFLGEFSAEMEKDQVGKHFVSITDPGSDLENISNSLKFLKVFINNPDIGGRFSALSYFGLVPASLTGIDLNIFMESSGSEAALCQVNDTNTNHGLRLGALIGSLAEKGVDKLTIFTSGEIDSLKYWIEQLVAESTGKNGKGVLPVPEYSTGIKYGKDRCIVYIKIKGDTKADNELSEINGNGCPLVVLELNDTYDLARQIYLWEFATAVAGHILRLNPFDQPDVESAKVFTRAFVKKYEETGTLEKQNPDFGIGELDFTSSNKAGDINAFNNWLAGCAKAGSYISVQAFLNPGKEMEQKVSDFKELLASGFGVPVTVGFGPRYLHSSGQLHKGDAGKGFFIQLTSDIGNDIPIPDKPFSDSSSLSFGILKNAQALGDYGALEKKGRNIVNINLGSDALSGMDRLMEIFQHG